AALAPRSRSALIARPRCSLAFTCLRFAPAGARAFAAPSRSSGARSLFPRSLRASSAERRRPVRSVGCLLRADLMRRLAVSSPRLDSNRSMPAPGAASGSPSSALVAGLRSTPSWRDMSAESAAAHISREEVAHLARLSRLAVTDDELDVFAGQLEVILGAVARVGEVAADDIPPTSHAV